VLLLHGEPSWSYLYRTMIPVLTAAGHRAVAPDLVGFGRSDKPARRADYTYQRHVDWMRATVEALDLRDITQVGQGWGGLIGLAAGGRDARPLRPRGRRQHLPAHRRSRPRARLPHRGLTPGD
jgi:haloalkane dehalogenase